jgi:hypothetical protein
VSTPFGDIERLDDEVLDEVLAMQLRVAWAGERQTDPPRLGWWRTAMVDELGGQDLFERLMPRTWKWAVFEAARAAAKRVDARGREATSDADQLVSLFRLGFALDEQLDDRLSQLKRSGAAPEEALPALQSVGNDWDQAAFAKWLSGFSGGDATQTPSGRRLKTALPPDPLDAAQALCAGLLPLAPQYPAPYYRLGR